MQDVQGLRAAHWPQPVFRMQLLLHYRLRKTVWPAELSCFNLEFELVWGFFNRDSSKGNEGYGLTPSSRCAAEQLKWLPRFSVARLRR